MLRLRELRIEHTKTQEQMAKILGVSRQVYANHENGINEPSLEMLSKIADFFDVSIDYLLGRSDELGNVVIKHDNPADELTTDERELLANFRKLDTLNKIHVSAYAKIRLEEQADGKGSRIG